MPFSRIAQQISPSRMKIRWQLVISKGVFSSQMRNNIYLSILQLFVGAAMGTQGSSKIFTKGCTTTLCTVQACICSGHPTLQRNPNQESFVCVSFRCEDGRETWTFGKKEAVFERFQRGRNSIPFWGYEDTHKHKQRLYQTSGTKYPNSVFFSKTAFKKKKKRNQNFVTSLSLSRVLMVPKTDLVW